MIKRFFGRESSEMENARRDATEQEKELTQQNGEKLTALLEAAAKRKGFYDINIDTGELEADAQPPEVTHNNSEGIFTITAKLPDTEAPLGYWPIVEVELNARNQQNEVKLTFGKDEPQFFSLNEINNFIRLAETMIAQANRYVYRENAEETK